MKLSFEKKINIVFLLVLIVLLNIAYFSYKNSSNNSDFWVTHTHEVLQKSAELSISLKNIQNFELKAILFPNKYSSEFHDSLKNISTICIGELKELTKDNVQQQVNISNLSILLNTASPYLKNYTKINDSIWIKIDTLINIIRQEENRLMVIRLQKNKATSDYLGKRFIILITLIFLLSTFLYYIIRKGRRRKTEFNKEIAFANQRIMNILESIGDPLFVLDQDKKFIYINSSASNKPGINRQNLIGKTIAESVNEMEDDLLDKYVTEAHKTKMPVTYHIYNANLNCWYDKTVYPTIEGFTIHEKDITKRKLVENELLNTKRLLEETNEIANIGGWEIDLVNNIINWTLVTRAILEVSPDYMTDLDTALKFYTEGETRERITRVINEAIELGTSFSEELDMISAKGNKLWVKAEGKPEFKNGKCIRIFGTFHDLTQEKILKEEIKFKEKQFTQAFKYAPTGIALLSLSGNTIDVNDSLCAMIGYKRNELLNLNFNEITYINDLAKSIELFNGAINGIHDSYHMEKRYIHKNKSFVWTSLYVSLLKDDKGNPLNIIAHISNITERKNAEKKLENSEQKFRELFEFLPAGIALIDMKTQAYLEVNESLLKLSGYTKDEFIQLSSEDRTPETFHLQDVKELEKLILTGHCGPYKKKSIKKNGEIYSVMVEGIKFTNFNAQSLILAVIQDITDIELKEQQLNDMNNLLQNSNKSLATINEELAQFSYIVSHDLKEPLRMVISFMDLLQKRYAAQLDEKANSFIDLAVDGGRRMQKMISDLLLYSSTGQNYNGREMIELGVLIEEIKLNLLKQINELHATIIVDDKTCTLPVFKSEILRLFQNIISNAIKFRKKEINPIIHIYCKEEKMQWLIAIKDNGIGMDSKNLDRIFEVFTRLHAANDYEGTGIGLAICKKIVKQHNGNIWAESIPDIGSTFYFTISK